LPIFGKMITGRYDSDGLICPKNIVGCSRQRLILWPFKIQDRWPRKKV
jgi:hypothetical protein